MQTIARLVMLNRIFDMFQYATQWPENSTAYFYKAEALIEVLEIGDCGSTGGYDPQNRNRKLTGFDLFDRFLTVILKYDDSFNIKSSCNANLATLVQYYTQLRALRDNVYKEFPAKR